MKLFRILALGIMFSLISGNTLLPNTGLNLADFTDTSTLPRDDTWIIIDNSGTTDDFRGLKIVLGKAEIENREIKLVFPNIVKIPRYAFYVSYQQPIRSLVSVSASKATDIGYWAFTDCDALAEVSLPLVTDIGVSAFSDCDALTEVTFPEATTIGDGAFSDCDALTKISIPLVTDIGEYMFGYCTALAEVHLPKATTIGDGAFSGCTALTTMIIATSSTLENIDADAFFNSYGSTSTDTTKITVYTSNANKKKFNKWVFKTIIGQ